MRRSAWVRMRGCVHVRVCWWLCICCRGGRWGGRVRVRDRNGHGGMRGDVYGGGRFREAQQHLLDGAQLRHDRLV